MSWDPEIIAAFKSGGVRLDIFLFVDATPTPLRVWTGLSSFTMAANGIDTTGGTYIGMGRLNSIPALNQLINGAAQRLEVSLSGVDAAVLDLADADAEGLRDAASAIGVVVFDEDYQPITTCKWLWTGTCDTPKVSRSAGGNGEAPVRTVSISLGTIFTGRKRPIASFYTGIDQRRRSSNDAFCDRSGHYTGNSTIPWP